MIDLIYLIYFIFILDEVSVISRIIEVEVRVISQSRRLRLLTLTEKKKVKSFFAPSSLKASSTKRKLDMITLRNNAPRSYMT